jgi:hypothetical protein
MKTLKTKPQWWKLGLGVLSVPVISIAHEYVYKLFKYDLYIAKTLDVSLYILLSFLFYGLASGSMRNTLNNLKIDWLSIIQDKRGIKWALLFTASLSLLIALFLGNMSEIVSFSWSYLFIALRVIGYGVACYLSVKAFLRLTEQPLSNLFGVLLFAILHAVMDYALGIPIHLCVVNLLWCIGVGYSILAKREGFSFTFATLFYVGVSCNLICNCNRYNIAGFTFVTEPATGLNETMGLLFGLLLLSMAFVAYYFYEYAYAYSLPMQEVVQKTKFAYQRTWGGKPLVIAELLPLLKKNRENIKIWTDAVISREDYEMSRRMSADESYYGIHGFQNGKWHRFEDGLLRHGEHATSNNDGRFRLNYNWRADRYLIKVIEKDKLYVGIFAIVNTLEEVQSYGKAYNFHAPPNVLSRWTKAPLYFRGQCALLYDISTGEEAYIRYDVINHPDGFRKHGRGFSSKSVYDND